MVEKLLKFGAAPFLLSNRKGEIDKNCEYINNFASNATSSQYVPESASLGDIPGFVPRPILSITQPMPLSNSSRQHSWEAIYV